MDSRLQLRVYENERLVYSHELTKALELGRQGKDEEEPFHVKIESGRSRLILARHDVQTISRRYVLVEPIAADKIRLTNLSSTRPLYVPDIATLGYKECCEVTPPLVLALDKDRIAVRIQAAEADEISIHGLAEVTAPPRLGSLNTLHLQTISLPTGLESKAFIKWLHAALDVLQSAASSADFLDKAACAAVELVNLDSARILLRNSDGWSSQASKSATWSNTGSDWQPSRAILSRLLQEKRTFWEMANLVAAKGKSLLGIKAVVVAPILNRDGEVIGALYGDRRGDSPKAAFGPITELEASLVELLARGVAAGLARMDQEQAALEARVRFEQFFTPQLARQLEVNPDLLQGRDAEVTLLFCDIRGFSRISERLGPGGTVAWIGDIMGTLSECVRARQGVLVDYIGDELIAMWGAPEAQPDHARLACNAALDMLARLPELNARWQTKLQEPMSFGIGINTGVARVGNMGSSHKFKYGPLGNCVNLASRVQGATKYLKCLLLLTGATQARLDPSFVTRRLGRVRVVNIAEPVDLYELSPADRPNWSQAKEEYEKALTLFESKQFLLSARILGNWRAQVTEDGPALILLHRAIQCEVEEPDPFDPVWELPGK